MRNEEGGNLGGRGKRREEKDKTEFENHDDNDDDADDDDYDGGGEREEKEEEGEEVARGDMFPCFPAKVLGIIAKFSIIRWRAPWVKNDLGVQES
eukprot:5928315-Pyramimonas_sp.AAC.1